jgi:hypothetical protein
MHCPLSVLWWSPVSRVQRNIWPSWSQESHWRWTCNEDNSSPLQMVRADGECLYKCYIQISHRCCGPMVSFCGAAHSKSQGLWRWQKVLNMVRILSFNMYQFHIDCKGKWCVFRISSSVLWGWYGQLVGILSFLFSPMQMVWPNSECQGFVFSPMQMVWANGGLHSFTKFEHLF